MYTDFDLKMSLHVQILIDMSLHVQILILVSIHVPTCFTDFDLHVPYFDLHMKTHKTFSDQIFAICVFVKSKDDILMIELLRTMV